MSVTVSRLFSSTTQDAMGIVRPGATYPGGPDYTSVVRVMSNRYTLRLIKPADVLLRLRLQTTDDRIVLPSSEWITTGDWLNDGDETDFTVVIDTLSAYVRFEVEYTSGSGTVTAWLAQVVGEGPTGPAGATGATGAAGPAGADGTVPDGDLGDVTASSGGTVLTIDNDAVTFAKMQNISNSRLVGRASASAGDPEEVSISQALDFASETRGEMLYRGAATWESLPVGTSGQLLMTNGAGADPEWTTPVIVPAGSEGEVQYHAAGGVQGAASKLTIGSSGFPVVGTGTPATPSSGLALCSVDQANKLMPGYVTPGGFKTLLNQFRGKALSCTFLPAGNTANMPGSDGIATPTIIGGSAAVRVVATTNMFTRRKRLGAVSTGGTGLFCGYRHAAQHTVGTGSGLGGFFLIFTFGFTDGATTTDKRSFLGFDSNSSAPTNVDPATLTNVIGVAKIDGSNNLHVVYGGSAAQTPINLGASFPATTNSVDLYEVSFYNSPNSNNTVYYEVRRLNTGDSATGTLTGTAGTALPASTTYLGYRWWSCSNTSANVVGIDMCGFAIEAEV